MANGNWNFTGEKNKDWREENKRLKEEQKLLIPVEE